VVISVAYLLHVSWYDFVSDDAFIALRYARRFLDGHGLVFNPSERVEGFSSILWVLLMATLGRIGADLVLAARVVGAVAGLVTILLTYNLARKLSRPGSSPEWALFAPSMLALNGSFACWAAAGLETTLFVGLIVATLLAVLSDKYWLSASLAATCGLARPEGIALAGLLAAYQVFRGRSVGEKRWVGWCVLCGSLLAALFLFRFLYYGDLLPNTYYAKVGGGWEQVKRGLSYFADYAADHEGLPVILVSTGMLLLSGPSGLRLLCTTGLLLWGVVIWVGGDGLPMYRFALAPLPLILVAESTLLERLYDAAKKWLPRRTLPNAILLLFVMVGWAVVQLTPPAVGSHYVNYEFQAEVEVPRWTRVGLWLKENAGTGESLAAVPIGAVSYYSGLIAYDMLGLTDRHIAHLKVPEIGTGWAGHEKHDGQYILQRRPTFLLLGNIDVTSNPRNRMSRPFIPYQNRSIFERERDMYDTDLIYQMYQPRSIEIQPGEFLNLYELRPEYHDP
jgi:hypothetical protein